MPPNPAFERLCAACDLAELASSGYRFLPSSLSTAVPETGHRASAYVNALTSRTVSEALKNLKT